jgi:hypothetical protein
MKRFEYEVSAHQLPRENRMRVFCSEKGECSVQEVPASDSDVVIEALNQRGDKGWELVEILFGRDGFICFWKREGFWREETIESKQL